MLEVRLAPPAASDDRPLDLPFTPAAVRAEGGRLGRELTASSLPVEGLSGARLSAFVEGLVLGDYRFAVGRRAKTGTSEVALHGASDTDALERGMRAAAATVWARDLANTPSDVKTPAWLAAQAVDHLTPLGVDVTVRDVDWLAEHGFGGVLAVGGGSAAPPQLIEASWRPRGSGKGPHVVLVGKGITFDTGGLNRKTGTNMNLMFTDMSGGAAVLGALSIIARPQRPVRVTVLVPAAENSISGSAYRPGDVVTHVGGRTSEITNTDAEGRLVLADALAYARATLKPTVLIDVATLTGAMKQALGLRTGGFFSTSDPLAAALATAGDAAGEPLWRMPLWGEYESTLRSEVADAVNAPGGPGAITAALFLKHFVGDLPWAHLDIAGPARAAKDDGFLSKGATGFGARLLAHYVDAL